MEATYDIEEFLFPVEPEDLYFGRGGYTDDEERNAYLSAVETATDTEKEQGEGCANPFLGMPEVADKWTMR